MIGRSSIVNILIGLVPTIWMAILLAPSMDDGLIGILAALPIAMEAPFRLTWCEDSFRTILIFIIAYGLGVGIYYSTKGNYRRGEEMGSAEWGDAVSINKKYADADEDSNKILTQNVKLGLDGRKHRRNLNVMVVGGSGSGKTRFYCKPNIMQANTSMVILDPKGENLKSTGELLKEKGYEIRILDLINMDKSHCYNPFVYIKDDNDAQRLVTNLFKSTTPKGATSTDPFWDAAAQMLLLALILYLKYEAPPEEQNFAMVMEMLRAGDIDEDAAETYSPLDRLFNNLGDREPDHIAWKYYNNYRSGSAKTLKTIQITLASRLDKFNLDSIAGLTMTDELELDKMGERKTALFALIPDNDTSFNFLISMLYTQLFQQLFYVADRKYGGRLPVHVHFIMDEFANLSLPDDFDKILAVMRSREVSVSIVLQNIAQLKALFEKQWESIVGNCDEFLYLGGNEQSTHKYVSDLLGKETININAHNRSYGKNGNYTTSDQLNGRELLDAAEVRLLDNRYALLFIRGERCIKDLKFEILKHSNIALTEDGGGKPYEHGLFDGDVADINIQGYLYEEDETEAQESVDDESTTCGFQLLADTELLKEIEEEEKNDD